MVDKNLNILIVEDEIFALEYLKEILLKLGFTNISTATNTNKAIEISKLLTLDLVFMDINIEGPEDGIICAKRLNEEGQTPIIYTTAYGDTNTINEANKSNIFGYLIKPFNSSNVEAVTNIAITFISKLKKSQKSKNTKDNCIKIGSEYCFNKNSLTLFFNDNPIKLTKKELDLVEFFSLNINQNITYDSLIQRIWEGKSVANSTIRDTISRLKKKIPNVNIENIPNIGYILKMD